MLEKKDWKRRKYERVFEGVDDARIAAAVAPPSCLPPPLMITPPYATMHTAARGDDNVPCTTALDSAKKNQSSEKDMPLGQRALVGEGVVVAGPRWGDEAFGPKRHGVVDDANVACYKLLGKGVGAATAHV